MTLVEVLVASVLLGVGVAGLLSAAALGLRNQDRSAERMGALYFAQEKLAEIDVVGPRIWALTESGSGTEPRGNVLYEYTVSIETMTEGELYDVQIVVKWSGQGGDGEIELEMLLNDYEAAAALGPELSDSNNPLEPEMPEGR